MKFFTIKIDELLVSLSKVKYFTFCSLSAIPNPNDHYRSYCPYYFPFRLFRLK